MNEAHELCGIRTEALRLAAWATYVGLIHNASPPRHTSGSTSFPRRTPPVKSQRVLPRSTQTTCLAEVSTAFHRVHS